MRPMQQEKYPIDFSHKREFYWVYEIGTMIKSTLLCVCVCVYQQQIFRLVANIPWKTL